MARLKKTKPNEEAKVHGELGGLDLRINEFGEIIGNKNIEEINAFLGRHVSDRKLEDRAGKFGEDSAANEEE